MISLGWFVLSLHYTLLLLLCLFGLHRLSMVFRWLWFKRKTPSIASTFNALPSVTVQIPIFNERNVAERVIDQTVLLDYPLELLEIQVVDDSTDDTYDLIASVVQKYQQRGINISHIHRFERHGFKAGGLRDAMAVASGDFIAIFDADFLPPVDFLQRTIHQFTDKKLAMVQARWGHVNVNSNRLTKVQSLMLDSHFVLEQQVRFDQDLLFNFNGTAGIWRKEAIVDAGNWSADTLTEDLDLSYRAYLKGWRLSYVNDLVCPAEIPSNMQAFKSQQHRWVKGGVQVLKKMLPTVLKSNLRPAQKVEATFHLSNNLAYFIMLVDALFFLIPSLIAREFLNIQFLFWFDIPLLMLSSGSHLLYLYYGQVILNKPRIPALINLPWLLLMGIRLAFNNARAAWEALCDSSSDFIRTPKSGELSTGSQLKAVQKPKRYEAILPSYEVLAEFIACFVFVGASLWAFSSDRWYMLPFMALFMLGFGLSAVSTLRSRMA